MGTVAEAKAEVLAAGSTVSTPVVEPWFRRRLLLAAIVCAVALAGLTALVYVSPYLAIDASIERAEQSINVGPLLAVFYVYMQIGGAYGVVVEAVVIALVLVLNRASWRVLVAGGLASGWYFLIVSSFFRARPSVPNVLRVTEHPAASSFPSGHTVLFVFYAVILMTCLGLKYIPRRWQPIGWALAVLFVLVGGFSRNYSGAHWPTDVLGGALIGVGWFCFVLSVPWISDPVLAPRAAGQGPHKPVLQIDPGLRVEMPSFIFHPVLLTLERFGLLVRGILYALVGVVAVAAMIGVSRSVDLQGSLALVLANSLKVPIAIVAAAGLFGYSLWGFVRAFADPLERGGNWHGLISRIGFLWSAIAYGGLALFAIQYAIGTATGGSGLPFGLNKLIGPQLTPFVLPVFGVVVLITGIGQFMDAWFVPFRTDFLPQDKSPRLWRWWVLAGRLGLLGRGVAFTVIGILMVQGGIQGDLRYDYGLTRAFAVLLGLPAGALALTIVALGFVALGVQSAASPPVLRMKPGLPPPVRRGISKET